ncbi:hypothetical protein [Niabella hibiscisoli]|uniref:hypothetical protein n=1 Tax=Niabella hibiscisoli TaxID=1825928 RepID=UPI001F0F2F97|nr:hypothetical protein [Niabella hibiscisoli]MCH5721027.1 hypothetical protein [Niabella hibiscisoli]
MLDQYWDELVKSKTEKEETAVLQKLAGYLQDHQISFEIFKDINGTLKDLGSISPADSLYPVTVKFQEPGSNAESVKSGWHPKSDDNTFFFTGNKAVACVITFRFQKKKKSYRYS